jgi:hypothetical protein
VIYEFVSNYQVLAAVFLNRPDVPDNAAIASKSASTACAPISVKEKETSADPFTALVLVPIVMFLDVPQLAVVISAEPLNEVPLIARAVASCVAEVAVPANVAVIVPAVKFP